VREDARGAGHEDADEAAGVDDDDGDDAERLRVVDEVAALLGPLDNAGVAAGEEGDGAILDER
jgi:hypothetical protein